MPGRWNRGDVELGQLWDNDGIVYRVVALIYDPVAVLAPADERDGEGREHLVIGSAAFAEWRRVELRHASGALEVPRDEPGDVSS